MKKQRWMKWGIEVAACLLVCSTTAMADVEIYGAAKFKTYFENFSKELTDGGENAYNNTTWNTGGETVIGFNFEQGDITGQWEMGAMTDENTGGSSRGGFVVREAWGQWDFGAGSLLIGHTAPLSDHVVAVGLMYDDEAGLQPVGGTGYDTDTGRVSQIRLTFGGFALALITPNTNVEVLDYNEDPVLGMTVRSYLPKLEARYDWSFQYLNLSAFGGVQAYKAETDFSGDVSHTVVSYLLAVAGEFNYKSVTFRAGVNYRQNGANYGLYTGVRECAYFDGTDIKNTRAIGAVASLGYTFTERFYMEVGGSYIHTTTDLAQDTKDSAYAVYLTSKFQLASGVSIHPEIVYYNYQDPKYMGESYSAGNSTHAGIYWVVEF